MGNHPLNSVNRHRQIRSHSNVINRAQTVQSLFLQNPINATSPITQFTSNPHETMCSQNNSMHHELPSYNPPNADRHQSSLLCPLKQSRQPIMNQDIETRGRDRFSRNNQSDVVLNKYFNGSLNTTRQNLVLNKYYDGIMIDQNQLYSTEPNSTTHTVRIDTRPFKGSAMYNVERMKKKTEQMMQNQATISRFQSNEQATFEQQIQTFTRQSTKSRKKRDKFIESQSELKAATLFLADYHLISNLFQQTSQSLTQISLLSINQDLLLPLSNNNSVFKSRQTFGSNQKQFELYEYLQFLNDLEIKSANHIDYVNLAHKQQTLENQTLLLPMEASEKKRNKQDLREYEKSVKKETTSIQIQTQSNQLSPNDNHIISQYAPSDHKSQKFLNPQILQPHLNPVIHPHKDVTPPILLPIPIPTPEPSASFSSTVYQQHKTFIKNQIKEPKNNQERIDADQNRQLQQKLIFQGRTRESTNSPSSKLQKKTHIINQIAHNTIIHDEDDDEYLEVEDQINSKKNTNAKNPFFFQKITQSNIVPNSIMNQKSKDYLSKETIKSRVKQENVKELNSLLLAEQNNDKTLKGQKLEANQNQVPHQLKGNTQDIKTINNNEDKQTSHFNPKISTKGHSNQNNLINPVQSIKDTFKQIQVKERLREEQEQNEIIYKKEIEMMLLDERIEKHKQITFQISQQRQLRVKKLINNRQFTFTPQLPAKEIQNQKQNSIKPVILTNFPQTQQQSKLEYNATSETKEQNNSNPNANLSNSIQTPPSLSPTQTLTPSSQSPSQNKYRNSYMNLNKYSELHKKKRDQQVNSFNKTLYNNAPPPNPQKFIMRNNKYYAENEDSLVNLIIENHIQNTHKGKKILSSQFQQKSFLNQTQENDKQKSLICVKNVSNPQEDYHLIQIKSQLLHNNQVNNEDDDDLDYIHIENTLNEQDQIHSNKQSLFTNGQNNTQHSFTDQAKLTEGAPKEEEKGEVIPIQIDIKQFVKQKNNQVQLKEDSFTQANNSGGQQKYDQKLNRLDLLYYNDGKDYNQTEENMLLSILDQVQQLKGRIDKDQQEINECSISLQSQLTSKFINTIKVNKDNNTFNLAKDNASDVAKDNTSGLAKDNTFILKIVDYSQNKESQNHIESLITAQDNKNIYLNKTTSNLNQSSRLQESLIPSQSLDQNMAKTLVNEVVSPSYSTIVNSNNDLAVAIRNHQQMLTYSSSKDSTPQQTSKTNVNLMQTLAIIADDRVITYSKSITDEERKRVIGDSQIKENKMKEEPYFSSKPAQFQSFPSPLIDQNVQRKPMHLIKQRKHTISHSPTHKIVTESRDHSKFVFDLPHTSDNTSLENSLISQSQKVSNIPKYAMLDQPHLPQQQQKHMPQQQTKGEVNIGQNRGIDSQTKNEMSSSNSSGLDIFFNDNNSKPSLLPQNSNVDDDDYRFIDQDKIIKKGESNEKDQNSEFYFGILNKNQDQNSDSEEEEDGPAQIKISPHQYI